MHSVVNAFLHTHTYTVHFQEPEEPQHFPQLPLHWLTLSRCPERVHSVTKHSQTVQTVTLDGPVWRQKTDVVSAPGQRAINTVRQLLSSVIRPWRRWVRMVSHKWDICISWTQDNCCGWNKDSCLLQVMPAQLHSRRWNSFVVTDALSCSSL